MRPAAKRAAVAATPLTPGNATPTSPIASTINSTSSGRIGVIVAGKSNGAWKTTPPSEYQ
ncbi:hypothetical protein D3C83_205770 [compost metagenome]